MSKLSKWGLLNSFKMFLVMANENDTLQQKKWFAIVLIKLIIMNHNSIQVLFKV
jgi:hypothetical protein